MDRLAGSASTKAIVFRQERAVRSQSLRSVPFRNLGESICTEAAKRRCDLVQSIGNTGYWQHASSRRTVQNACWCFRARIPQQDTTVLAALNMSSVVSDECFKSMRRAALYCKLPHVSKHWTARFQSCCSLAIEGMKSASHDSFQWRSSCCSMAYLLANPSGSRCLEASESWRLWIRIFIAEI